MKTSMKTSELIGPALDWAVAKCEGLDYWEPEIGPTQPEYSTNWSQGGLIIERAGISLSFESIWIASIFQNDEIGWAFHADHESSPLVAAMRCYVASKLGDEIEIGALEWEESPT